jgi:hypothetical protein
MFYKENERFLFKKDEKSNQKYFHCAVARHLPYLCGINGKYFEKKNDL